MVQYLSDEWMDEAAAALSGLELDGSEGAAPVLFQYEITAAPGGKRSYGLRIDDGRVTLEPGPHKDASTSFTLDYEVASEIARGALSTQAAFMQGRLKLGGDVMVLVRSQAVLDGLTDALGPLRERTEY